LYEVEIYVYFIILTLFFQFIAAIHRWYIWSRTICHNRYSSQRFSTYTIAYNHIGAIFKVAVLFYQSTNVLVPTS